jgi:hypothetical protein
MDNAELAEKIKQLGIDFDLTDDYLQALQKAGAQDVLIQALRAVQPKPLTRAQVLGLVAGYVPSQRAATLVKQRGIDFLADDEYLRTLRVAGADETLIRVLREANAATPAELLLQTSPYAEVFLDGKLQGQAHGQGGLAIRTKPGAHALKVSLKGKKDFERVITLLPQQATRVEARLKDLAP